LAAGGSAAETGGVLYGVAVSRGVAGKVNPQVQQAGMAHPGTVAWARRTPEKLYSRGHLSSGRQWRHGGGSGAASSAEVLWSIIHEPRCPRSQVYGRQAARTQAPAMRNWQKPKAGGV